MFAFGSAAPWTISAASLTSNRPRSRPPVMLSRMPVAPSTDSSSSGLEIAVLGRLGRAVLAAGLADAHQRRAGVGHDRADVGEVEVDEAGDRDQVGDALDALAQDVVGLAERLEDRRAALDDRRAASRSGSRSACRRPRAGAAMPSSAWRMRCVPSKSNGCVTTPTVSAPISFLAISAITGAAPVPVPPPSPAVTNTMSAPLSASLMSSRDSAAAPKPTSGLAPGAEALGQLVADVELDVGVAHLQRLRVGVRGDELDAAQAGVDHAVDRIGAAAADADDLDDREVAAAAFHVVPSDLQVRVERFAARGLPLRACTVSTGVERCQRKCTRARFLAESGTLKCCRRFPSETNPRAQVEGQVMGSVVGGGLVAPRRGRCPRRRAVVGALRVRGSSGGGSRPPAAGRSGRRTSR